MVFLRQSRFYQQCYEPCYEPYYEPCYEPCYQPCYQPWFQPSYQRSCRPCYPNYGYGRPTGYSGDVSCYEPSNDYGGYGYSGSCGYGNQGSLNYGYGPGYGYGYGYGYGSHGLRPCSYGYHYTNRGSCYNPRKYRCGYGARREPPSSRYGYYGGYSGGCAGGYCGPF